MITEIRIILETCGNILNDSNFMTNGFLDNRQKHRAESKTFLLPI